MSNDVYTAKNERPNQEEVITLDCQYLWSKAHVFCYKRLSERAKGAKSNKYDLVDLFEARAKRIAATYARFYLETEEGGNPAKLGRYYWMALGAFASKTVYCLLHTCRIQNGYAFGASVEALLKKNNWTDLHEIGNGLAKGNLWLFIDIASSHWMYNNSPESYKKGAQCEIKRDSSKLLNDVKVSTNKIPWAKASQAALNNLAPSDHIIKGFDEIVKFETATKTAHKEQAQLSSLIAIAEHEQGAILQPLIYQDPDFKKWCRRQRNYDILRWFSPKYELVFSHACSIDDPELKSEAPDTMVVEDYTSRMDWIVSAAEDFDNLMKTRTSYMHAELKTIAGWVNTPDAQRVYTRDDKKGFEIYD